jgi:hypothetical protein
LNIFRPELYSAFVGSDRGKTEEGKGANDKIWNSTLFQESKGTEKVVELLTSNLAVRKLGVHALGIRIKPPAR